MKNNFKSRKLQVLVVLAGITYVLMFINSFVDGWDDFKQGFADGSSVATKNAPWGYRTFTLFSEDDKKFKLDSLINLSNNQRVEVSSQTIRVKAPLQLTHRISWLFYLNNLVIVPLVVVAIILVPIYFFRILGLVKASLYFNDKCIRTLRKLAIALFVIYFGFILDAFIWHTIALYAFKFPGYKTEFRLEENIWLMFGILALIVAELLTKAKSLKEEQDLTI